MQFLDRTSTKSNCLLMKRQKILVHRQNFVAKGQLEAAIGIVLLEFEVADSKLRENFVIMENLQIQTLVPASFAGTMQVSMSIKVS